MTSRQSKPGRGRSPRRLRRFAPEVAAVLWFGLFVAVTPIALPAIGLSWLADVLRWVALIVVVACAAGFVAVAVDEAWLAVRRSRIRRRAARRGGAWEGWR